MNILAIAAFDPMPDRSTGDLRFFELLKGLAKEHEVHFCAFNRVKWVSEAETNTYRAALEQSGVTVHDRNPIAAIKSGRFDVILFEFYFAAKSYIDEARYWQPAATILVDSVDIHFHRLFAKARLTRADQDYAVARDMKVRELATYRKADVVITVSEADGEILRCEGQGLPVEVVPLIQPVPPLADSLGKDPHSLLFIGNFHHDPNVDAILYFCDNILPLITREVPDIKVTIVGNGPPEQIKRLAGKNVDVLGFVPDIKPILGASAISIAPLRYGGGIKGKICEAMAYGLPVVTTSVGTEGMALSPGENVLVGDTAEEFANAVVRLIRERGMYESVRTAAWAFVNDHYSVVAVSRRIQELANRLDNYPVKKLSPAKALGKAVRYHFDRHISWRLKQAKE